MVDINGRYETPKLLIIWSLLKKATSSVIVKPLKKIGAN